MKPNPLFVEKLLNITDHEEFLNDEEFNLKTTYEQENLKDSKEILSNFSLINKKYANIAPIKQPKLLKRLRKELDEENLGDRWGDMKKQDNDPDLEKDLRILQLRKFISPKSFFKGSENKSLPKYYQVGTILEGGDDFVSGRLKRREKKNSLVDLFLKDDQENMFSRRKFQEIQKEKQKFRRNRTNSKFQKLKKFGKKIKRR